MICISCGRTNRYIASSIDPGMHWLRMDETTGLGICSFCADLVEDWDQGARDVQSLAVALRTKQRNDDLTGWLIEHAKLPSLPHVLIEIYKELESDTASIERMVTLIETDPALTARALQLGNSAYYGSPKQTTQVSDVILRVGPFDLWALLISTEVKSLFFGIRPDLVDMHSFWRHSLLTACACRKLAEGQGLSSSGDLFIAGLIHDLGKLVFLQQLPIEYADVVTADSRGDALCQLEKEHMGVDHATLGARLFETWQFPEELVQMTLDHHQPDSGSENVQLLRQADQLAYQLLDKSPSDSSPAQPPDPLTGEVLSLYERLMDLVL